MAKRRRYKGGNSPFPRVVGEPIWLPPIPQVSQTAQWAVERRRNPTPAEELMWTHLMSLNKGVLALGRVQREWVFGDPVTNKRYVLDFYIPEVRLGIEVDGPIHDEDHQQVRDRAKELALERLGIYLHRVSNDDVMSSDMLKLTAGLRAAWTNAARLQRARRGSVPAQGSDHG